MDDRNPPPDPKGKAPATTPAAAATSSSGSTDPERPSVLSRIVRSAAGLGRDALAGRPHSGDLVGLASNNSSSKAGPSPAGGNSSSSTEGYARDQSGEQRHAATSSTAFVAGHTRQHIAAQEDAFARFLDGADIDTSIPDDLPGLVGFQDVAPPAVQPESEAPTSFSAAVAEQQSRDGIDVVHLLAGGHGAEEEPDYGQDVELAEDEVAGLQRALFGSSPLAVSSTTTVTSWDHVLNFTPAFMRPTPGSISSDGDSHTLLGVGQSPEATRLWLGQWRDVLTRYDEEVWGGLAPLVAEARDEVEQLDEAASIKPPDGPSHSTRALGRLQQILGHLRGSQ
ncbi:hypothetical protein CMQ_5996 [Grosmannia clavigera kw1407]|uniref:Uncharacterized protein n=1 Tax=Grosmannia clavigera (strain kw1407 / UAMH 11150) TaxID=655863 RepID=F0XMK7_GROCL|nr:uncharacterized protein CMQ_5996 [Grosmannia clavigera kw1407]EFX01054.1 hypothetical protein CMQ_5996 [Grosmannia clavigera kw1407]